MLYELSKVQNKIKSLHVFESFNAFRFSSVECLMALKNITLKMSEAKIKNFPMRKTKNKSLISMSH